ncbi:MAG: Wzt carbohydrate-binding domain-containing protein [Acidobacteria bacterium]|nr:Wzt carbohydrate-binding domain-containing protein [Acidobacteriota bacterium]
MSDAVISLRDVSKLYRRYAYQRRFSTLKSALLKGSLASDLRPHEVVRAVDAVTLAVPSGACVGLIGRNGSGKSTLLKLVTGITSPTSGSVEVRGRVAALIELGAGFHPEISGRENIFVNGVMLGRGRREIAKQFDEIVEFAELEDFIDAPVKTYSTGMYMRLGFSVAVHVDPDILVVDEVLAVGDEAFGQKCRDKFSEFKRRGRTILLATHGLNMVERFCDEAIWIDAGRVRAQGDPRRVVHAYTTDVARREEEDIAMKDRRALAAVADLAAVPAAPAAGDGAPRGGEGAGPPGDGAPPGASAAAADRTDPGEGTAAEDGTDAGDGTAAEDGTTPGGGASRGDGAAPGDGTSGEASPGDEPPPGRESSPGDGEVPVPQDMFQATEGRWGAGPVRIERVTIERGGNAAHVFQTGDRLAVRLGFHTPEPVRDFVFGIGIFSADGTCCYGTNTDVEGFEPVELSGSGEVVFAIDSLDLVEGTYKLDVAAHTRRGVQYDYHRLLYTFRVKSHTKDAGIYRPRHQWTFSPNARFGPPPEPVGGGS